LDKQQQIQAAALKLFVQFGFHGTPTSKIAQEAAVANGTLFHYYPTKDHLVIGLYNNIKDDLSISLSGIIHESEFIVPKFRSIFINTLYWALNNKQKFYYMQQFECSPHLTKISAETIRQQTAAHTQLIAEGVRKKLLQSRPLELLLSIFNSHIFGVYLYLRDLDLTPDEQRRHIEDAYEMIWELMRYK
jgi:AcrR family transcriptional regulator